MFTLKYKVLQRTWNPMCRLVCT